MRDGGSSPGRFANTTIDTSNNTMAMKNGFRSREMAYFSMTGSTLSPSGWGDNAEISGLLGTVAVIAESALARVGNTCPEFLDDR
jgi:hypothetical protein